jgi:hypothetical protein
MLERDPAQQGERFQNLLTFNLCGVFGTTLGGYASRLWLEPSIAPSGAPVRDGYGCELSLPVTLGASPSGIAQPDFIIKQLGPASFDHADNPSYLKAYLIGDVTRNLKSMRRKIEDQPSQVSAVMNYARYSNRHQYNPIALYVTLFGGDQRDAAKMVGRGLQSGVVPLITTLFPNRRG